jgi:aspartate/methionine/tyrosine aminotransferase
MYVFPKIKEQTLPGDAFSEKMLEKGVSIVPGNTFGKYPDFFRISLGQPREVIVEGIRRMGEALS